ncbi:MAG TPA: type II toxin-antitoxin system VapB family antitoxin [Candidatus Binataceae bacterium]|nr:type II toxin-antitoxin system VapB family antitoxin [Candidatus Binataceae bacterium]
MSLNVKNAEAHKLAQELAGITGESMATAVTEALRERLARKKRTGLARELMDIGRDCATRMNPKTRRTDHGDLLYDRMGLPK